MVTKFVWRSMACGVLASAVWGVSAGSAQAQSNELSNCRVYGVKGFTGELVRYEFPDSQFHSIAPVHFASGYIAGGIEGMARIPGQLNLFAFWSDPADERTKLLYVNCETAEAVVVGQDLGVGKVTGATYAWKDGNNELDDGDTAFTGLININPNNSNDNEFILTPADPDVPQITRDDLHQNSPVDGEGDFFEGTAAWIRIRPKGNDSQVTFTANGQGYPIQNNNTYVLSGGEMTVRVYNDHIHNNGKAMGKWWLEISDSGSATIQESGGTEGYLGVFVLQTIEAQEEAVIPFEVVSGSVEPAADYAAKVQVAGSAMNIGTSNLRTIVFMHDALSPIAQGSFD